MQKNGFMFIETIIAIVILTSALLLLYSSFTKILQTEKSLVYYDDVNYIYRSWHIKNALNGLNIMSALKGITTSEDKYFVTVGIDYENLFDGYENERQLVSNLMIDYDVNQIIILKENKIDDLKKCTIECSLDSTCRDYENCNDLYTTLSDEMVDYLKSIYIDVSSTYVMVIEYITCNKDDTNCKNYYSWVSV